MHEVLEKFAHVDYPSTYYAIEHVDQHPDDDKPGYVWAYHSPAVGTYGMIGGRFDTAADALDDAARNNDRGSTRPDPTLSVRLRDAATVARLTED